MLIIEEVSTCVEMIFGSIDACLRQLKECSAITTVGTHIICYENWLQFGPIVGPTLFTQPSPNSFKTRLATTSI
jgi:hypothetical protein